jgi:hypothetical protein
MIPDIKRTETAIRNNEELEVSRNLVFVTYSIPGTHKEQG